MSRVNYVQTEERLDQQQIRSTHGVRLVTDTEEGMGVNALPPGVYGFTYSPGLASSPLFAVKRFRSYEIHKLPNGEVVLIAYADATAQTRLAAGDVITEVHPDPTPDAEALVQIPYSRIRHHRQYAAPNQGGFQVTLGPL